MMSEALVKTENLTKFYGDTRGISELELEVKRGEVFGFLGPNGAGKTTTIRLLLDLIRPTSGRAQVFGLDTQKHSVAIRRRSGYLPGEFSFYNHLTGREFLGYFSALRGKGNLDRAEQLAERLESDLGRPVNDLSHGSKQKIGLIQAFMNDPDLLILDEPTAGLDPLIQQEFYRLIDEVCAAGKTVFLSSHVLPEVERVCDRVGIVKDGRLVAVEDVSAIKEKAIRKIEVTFASDVEPSDFSGLSVSDMEVSGRRLSCRVSGSVDHLVKAVARFEVIDFISHEPSLEEVFLALYGGERDAR
jgi:ABC-2 type transport system ATP-binding protein